MPVSYSGYKYKENAEEYSCGGGKYGHRVCVCGLWQTHEKNIKE